MFVKCLLVGPGRATVGHQTIEVNCGDLVADRGHLIRSVVLAFLFLVRLDVLALFVFIRLVDPGTLLRAIIRGANILALGVGGTGLEKKTAKLVN